MNKQEAIEQIKIKEVEIKKIFRDGLPMERIRDNRAVINWIKENFKITEQDLNSK